MRLSLKKIFTAAVLVIWQSGTLSADMGPMMMPSNQETQQSPTVTASAAPVQTQPQTSTPEMAPVQSLGGTEMSLTPASAPTPKTAEATAAPQPAEQKSAMTTSTSTAPAPSTQNSGAPDSETNTENTPDTNAFTSTIIPEGELPPGIDEEYKTWMEDPMVKNLIEKVKYCKNKQDCDDFAQQLHVYLTLLGIESMQVGIYPGYPKPPEGELPPLVLTNLAPKPPEGHAMVATVTEIDGKKYMCLYEPQSGERFGCTEIPTSELSVEERNEELKKLTEIWMQQNHPTLNHTVTSNTGINNVDPSDGRPPYLDPETNINLNTPEGQNINNLRRCFYIMQQDGSSQLFCTEGN